MMVVRPEDVVHKMWLLRVLTEIADNSVLAESLIFKGGTCASMLGFLDRFSVDLDFDLKPQISGSHVLHEFQRVFKTLEVTVHRQSPKTLTFLLKYPNPRGSRNSMKLNALPNTMKANQYEPQYLAEIDRMLICQTIETMFANKLVAPLDRFQKYHAIAGRDFYDMHHFFLAGHRYKSAIIEERTKMKMVVFLKKLIDFTQKRLTEKIITEDLSTLLPASTFQKIRHILKTETLMFLQNELERLRKGNFGK